MKKAAYSTVFILLVAGSTVITGCPSKTSVSPTSPGAPTNTFTPTATPTPTGPTSTPTTTATNTPTATITNTPTLTPTAVPVTITVNTQSSSDNSQGYIYVSSAGTNNTGAGGLLSLSAHVGDSIILPANGTHPLWFDNGTSTCLVTGGDTSGPVTYTFPSTGTYNFHCGNHGGCTPSDGACGLSTCSAMVGVVTVN